MNSVRLQDTKSTYTKSVVFLYANNDIAENRIKKTIPFIIAAERINKIHRNSFNQGSELSVYNENTKALMKETGKDTKKGYTMFMDWKN
jgi:hypothetical protein